MTPLIIVLSTKIIVSLILVVLPFLLMPKEQLNRLTDIEAKDDTLYRLYALAILALLVGYTGAFIQAWHAVYPLTILIMGLVSNGSAAIVLLKKKGQKHQATAGLFFGAVAILIAAFLVFPEFAMQALI